MSHQPVIDGGEGGAAGAALRGTFPLDGFARLRGTLASDAGEVAYVVQGLRDERGRPCLRAKVRGAQQLRCQRCLEALELDVDVDKVLVLAASQAEIDAEPAGSRGPDRVLAGRDMPVRDLIEDELILAMPYAPRHERCAAAAPASAGARRFPFTGRRGMHRSHDFLTRPALAIEPTTGEVHLRHRVSPTGFYRGKKVVKDKTE